MTYSFDIVRKTWPFQARPTFFSIFLLEALFFSGLLPLLLSLPDKWVHQHFPLQIITIFIALFPLSLSMNLDGRVDNF